MLVLFLQLLWCCSSPFMHSVALLLLILHCFFHVPFGPLLCPPLYLLPSVLYTSLPLSLLLSLPLTRPLIGMPLHALLSVQAELSERTGEGGSQCLAAETGSSWRVTTLNDHPHTHTHHTHIHTKARAISHTPILS